jgi:hypothetical protein
MDWIDNVRSDLIDEGLTIRAIVRNFDTGGSKKIPGTLCAPL